MESTAERIFIVGKNWESKTYRKEKKRLKKIAKHNILSL